MTCKPVKSESKPVSCSVTSSPSIAYTARRLAILDLTEADDVVHFSQRHTAIMQWAHTTYCAKYVKDVTMLHEKQDSPIFVPVILAADQAERVWATLQPEKKNNAERSVPEVDAR